MAKILYVLVIPTDEEVTLFQGWGNRLRNPEFLSLLATACVAPFDTGEIFIDQEQLISLRGQGSRRNVVVIGDKHIDKIPFIIENNFTVILATPQHVARLTKLQLKSKSKPIIATTREMPNSCRICFDEISNPVHYLDHHIFEKIQETTKPNGVVSEMIVRAPYTTKAKVPFYGSGSTLANELSHQSLGIILNGKERIKPDQIENFQGAIAKGVKSLLSLMKEEDKSTCEAIVYAPSIKSFFYNTNSNTWNQILRRLKATWQKDFIKNGLIKNPGYSGISVTAGTPIENPYDIPIVREILLERQAELALTNYSIALLASSECAPAIRLPNAVNLHAGDLKEIETLHKRGDKKSALQLQVKFRTLSESLRIDIGEQLGKLIAEQFSGCTICSDAPLEWAYLGNLPLMLSHEVSTIPMTPGNMLLQQAALGQAISISASALKDILVIRSFQKNDPIRNFLEIGVSVFPLENGTKVNFIDVSSQDEIVVALNEFQGAIVIFDCHGDHSGREGSGWLQIGSEKLDSWNLFDKARVPPIIMLSACSTAPIAGSHASVASGFIRSGALSVIGTFLPVNAMASSAFVSRIIFRIDAFLPALKNIGYDVITWRTFISGFMRMSYATDVLRYFEDECHIINSDQYHAIHSDANFNINSMNPDWYQEMIKEVSLYSSFTMEQLTDKIKLEHPLMETMLYCQRGRPDLINIIL